MVVQKHVFSSSAPICNAEMSFCAVPTQPSDAAPGPEAKAMQTHPKGGTAMAPVSGGLGTDNPNRESLFEERTQSGELQIEAPRSTGNGRLIPAVEDPIDGTVNSADKDILDGVEMQEAIPVGSLGGIVEGQELDTEKSSDLEQEPAGLGLELAEEKESGVRRAVVREQDGSQSLMQANEPMESGGTEAQNTAVPPCESFPNEEMAASPPVLSANPPQSSELLATPRGEEQADGIGTALEADIGRDENAVAQASSGEATGHCEQASEEAGPSAAEPLQLFVKLFDGRTVLVRADPSMSTEALLEQLG
jgi:hypothetical protein